MATPISDIPADTVTINDRPIFEPRRLQDPDLVDTPIDELWAKRSFLLPGLKYSNPNDVINRYWSAADRKFTDTQIGGNIGVNSRPQRCRYADIRVPGRLQGRNGVSVEDTGGNYGMGWYYSRAVDDPQQRVWLRLGVPQFNSLSNFLSKAFNHDMVTIAKTGRGPSSFYEAGKIAGTLFSVTAIPQIAFTVLAGKALVEFFGQPTCKFYTLKPTMNTFWAATSVILNGIAINRGIIPRMMRTAAEQTQSIGSQYIVDDAYLAHLQKLMPDIYTSNVGIDVFAIATKATCLMNQANADDDARLNTGSATNYIGYVQKGHQDKIALPNIDRSLAAFIERTFKFGYYQTERGTSATELNPKIDATTGTAVTSNNSQSFSFYEYYRAERQMGGGFAVFCVDHPGSASEAFGNSSTESDLSQKFNSISAQARETRFNFMEGNLTDNPIGNMIDGAMGAVKDVVAGAASGVSLGLFDGLQGLMGAGYIDIPKHWQDSSANFTRANYTATLISPYGNPISQLQNIYLPLAMLLAATCPLAVGSQGYGSPFLVQLFHRGFCQIQLGLVESLSITRGVSNQPFTLRGDALAIDVAFTVVDLSTIMYMPISTGSLFKTDNTLNEDSPLFNYLAVLAAQGIEEQLYPFPKAKLALARQFTDPRRITSPAYMASLLGGDTPAGFLSSVFFGNNDLLK